MAKKTAQGQEVAPSAAAGDFLGALAQKLQHQTDVDTDLAKVLTKHVLVVAQSANSVQLAKDAILKLASERAQPVTTKGSADDKA